jgi:hypothetical protein
MGSATHPSRGHLDFEAPVTLKTRKLALFSCLLATVSLTPLARAQSFDEQALDTETLDALIYGESSDAQFDEDTDFDAVADDDFLVAEQNATEEELAIDGNDSALPEINPELLRGEFSPALLPLVCPDCPTFSDVNEAAKNYSRASCLSSVRSQFYPKGPWYNLSAAGRFHQLQLAFDVVLPKLQKTPIGTIFGGTDRGYDFRLRPMMSCMMYHESAQPHPQVAKGLVGYQTLALNYNLPACNPPRQITRAVRVRAKHGRRSGGRVVHKTYWTKGGNSTANGLGQVVRKTFVGTFATYTSEDWVKQFLDPNRYKEKPVVASKATSAPNSTPADPRIAAGEWRERWIKAFEEKAATVQAADESDDDDAESDAIFGSHPTKDQKALLTGLFDLLPKDIEIQISASLAAMAFHKSGPGKNTWYGGLRTYGPTGGPARTYAPTIFSCAACLINEGIMAIYQKQQAGQKLTLAEETRLINCLTKATRGSVSPDDYRAAGAIYQFTASSGAKSSGKSSKKHRSHRRRHR